MSQSSCQSLFGEQNRPNVLKQQNYICWRAPVENLGKSHEDEILGNKFSLYAMELSNHYCRMARRGGHPGPQNRIICRRAKQA
jgi:hypothetical protein